MVVTHAGQAAQYVEDGGGSSTFTMTPITTSNRTEPNQPTSRLYTRTGWGEKTIKQQQQRSRRHRVQSSRHLAHEPTTPERVPFPSTRLIYTAQSAGGRRECGPRSSSSPLSIDQTHRILYYPDQLSISHQFMHIFTT